MGCKGDSTAVGESRQKMAAALADRPDELVRHRLAWCCRATECGRICTWLVKAPGKAAVRCVHPDARHDTTRPLYGLLADTAFACPAGRF